MQGYDFYKKMSVFLVQVQTIPQFIILFVMWYVLWNNRTQNA